MRACVAAAALCLLLAGGARSVEAEADGTALHSDDGAVMRATLASGAVVSLSGPMDVRLAGTSARVTHGSGLRASARVEDVEVIVGRDVESASGAIALGCGAHVALREARRSTVRLDVFGLALRLQGVEVPRDALALRGGVGVGPCGTPRPARFDGAPRRLLPRAGLRVRIGGPRVPVALPHGAYVVPGPSREGFVEVLLEDSGTRVVGWVAEGELEAPSTPPGGAGGGGLGEGRIGLEACRDPVAHTVELSRDSPLLASAGATRTLATIAAGTVITVGPIVEGRVPVLGLPGVSRVARCARPIGWIAGDARP